MGHKAKANGSVAVMLISQANPVWDKVVVDPRSRDRVSYQPMIAPVNRTAVPAP